MKRQLTKLTSIFTLIVAPAGTALATASNFSALITQLMGYIKLLVPFIIGLTLLVFLWGIFKFIFAGGSDKDVTEGAKLMTWGIVSLFVMVSVWGLVSILTKTFFNDNVIIPQLKSTMLIEQGYINRV